MFSARIQTASGSEQAIPDGVRLAPQSYSKTVRGGCMQAEVLAYGGLTSLWPLMRFVGQRIVILNSVQTPVWWGVIEEVLVNRGGLLDGLSIREMYNRVRVAYSYERAGASYSGMTDWAVNQESIDTLGFVKEFVDTLSINATPSMAAAYRDKILSIAGSPVAVTESGGDAVIAQIHCTGDFNTFGWKYYAQPKGLEAHEAAESAEQEVGQAISSNLIGFTSGGKVHDLGGRFNGNVWRVGAQVRASGSVNNNIVGIVTATDTRQLVNMSTAQISFEATDDITDSTNGSLTYMAADDIISVTGTSSSNGVRRVKSADPEHVVVRGGSYTGESGPPNGIITRGNFIQIDSGIATDTNQEFPNQTVTIATFGTPSIQRFQTLTDDWTLNQVELNLAAVGSPTDNFKVEICQNNNGAIGPLIESATVAGMALGAELSTVVFQFSNTTILDSNLAFWLRLSRTGASDANSYYVVEVDEANDYQRGVFQVWDGISYVPRDPPVDLVFSITGAWETTEQIRQIVAATGQYVTKVDLRTNSGIWTNQYRAGDTLAYDELMALLDIGTDHCDQMFAEVTPEQILRITHCPNENPDDVQQMPGGRYLDEAGRALPQGFLPVGRWINRPDIPAGAAQTYKLTPRLCIEAEYDCINDEISSVRYAGSAPPDSDSLFGVL